jgi:hypothetical protein
MKDIIFYQNVLVVKTSDETKLKLSKINTGRKHSEETKQKIRNFRINNK